MAGPFFDVYVVGATDASPAGLAKLASALSGPLGMPAPLITKALAERRLCAGKGLVQQDAQALVRDLKPLGAQTLVRPTAPNDTPTRIAAPPAARPVPPPPVRPAPPPPVRAATNPTPTRAAAPSFSAGPPSLSLEPEPAGADPFAPPPSGPRSLALDEPTTANVHEAPAPDLDLAIGGRSEPPAGRDAFSGAVDEDPRLELDIPSPKATPAPAPSASTSIGLAASGERARPSGSLPGASAMNLNNMAASSSASGLSVDRAVAAEAYRVRCHKHGLLYDTRKASGCGKCMEAGRKMSAAIDARAAGFKIADFGDEAWKRAFIGLAVALVVGFIPAAYHAFRVGAHDIHRLRDEQELLSRKPATEEIVRDFEELDRSVDSATNRATRTTGIVWLVMTGATLAGWYRVTS
jgi:hypothetical protein